MTCAQAHDLMSASYDGDLDATEQMQFGAHLRSCSRCAADAAEARAALDGLTRYLGQVAAVEQPRTRFVPPAPTPSNLRWQLAFAACAAGLLALLAPAALRPGPPEVESIAALSVDRATVGTCPWLETHPDELATTISYPVLATDCLEDGLELLNARIQAADLCPERVRLTYGVGDRRVVLDQQLDTTPSCCSGEHVAVGDSIGCAEQGPSGEMSLRWTHNHHAFRLSGDLGMDAGLQLAQAISEVF